MVKIENKKAQATARAGQAAIELAVFGAILIFILGTIVRAAVNNGYMQNESFKAMRLAMLNSWKGSESNPSSLSEDTSRNNASVIFVEDRLSPDFNKYGDLDRQPYISQGSGTFTYNLEYPWQIGSDTIAHLIPIMDVYVNGQYFPLSTATFVMNRPIQPYTCPMGNTPPFPPPALGGFLTPAQCAQNQCLRNNREWAGGNVYESQFETIVSATTMSPTTGATMQADASTIFNQLVLAGYIQSVTGTDFCTGVTCTGGICTGVCTAGNNGLAGHVTSITASGLPSSFGAWLETAFPGTSQTQVNQIQSILQSNQAQYKLFYTREPLGSPNFSPYSSANPPPACSNPPGNDQALCSSLTMTDAVSGLPYTNTNGDLQYDLLRNADYNSGSPTAVETQFPDGGALRNYVAWQWAASAAVSSSSIGLDPSSYEYPTYDIDGRLKEVTIYSISQDTTTGYPTVSYEDYQNGDIDSTWDSTSCGPKPGLQNDSEIYTFTKAGTYLQVKEGKLYNPETDQFVRSANQRDTIDLIQRAIQLSNNTGDFCNGTTLQPAVMSCQSPNPCSPSGMSPTSVPNPVEVCVSGGTGNDCFTPSTIAETCYDTSDNIIYVRSRLQDTRGRFWMTDTTGKLLVH